MTSSEQLTASKLIPLHSQLLSGVPGVIHGITHRVEGMGKADGNVSFASPRDREDAWEMRQLWSETNHLAVTELTHGVDVLVATADHAGAGAAPGSVQPGLADALITNHPNVALTVTHADCLSILIVDPEQKAIGTIHAG